MCRKIFFIVCAVVSLVVLAGNAAAASVEMFSPEGTVKDIGQVTARFSDQMVAFGDPRPAEPFDIQCTAKGSGRWIDGRNWSYDFENPLPAGIACTFILKPGVKSLAGTAVKGKRSFTFNTGGPAVRISEPYEGSLIEENQTFLFRLDAPATDHSVIKNVSCTIEGVRERVGIRLITGEERIRILKSFQLSKKEQENAVIFQCRQAAPPKAKVKIIWGKGVVARNGMATRDSQVLEFKARGPFTARFYCMKEKPTGGCIPLSPIRLSFSAPIAKKDAQRLTITAGKDAAGKSWKARMYGEGENETQYLVFDGPFPERTSLHINIPGDVKDISGRALSNANKFPLPVNMDRYPALAKFPEKFGVIESKEGGLLPVTVRNIEEEIKTWLERAGKENEGVRTDISGNVTQPKTDEKKAPGSRQSGPPAAQGNMYKAVKGSDQAIMEWLFKLDNTPRERSVLKGTKTARTFSVPKPGGTKEFEVIGIPLSEPGFYVVEIESLVLGTRLLAKPAPLYVPTAALVTNMTAHFKWGRESSLVFVTALDTGSPVPNASVSIRDCQGRLVWQGGADANGIAHIKKALPDKESLPQCNRGKQEKDLYYDSSRILSETRGGLFVFARSGNDMTFTHSNWNDGIEPWRFNLGSYGERTGSIIGHTVFDRTLLRAGETVHMKHFARIRTMEGLRLPPNIRNYKEVVINHSGSNEKYTLAVSWNNNGTAENMWRIPASAKLGTYDVYFRKAPKSDDYAERVTSGSFRVEEFRVPLMRGYIRGPKEPSIDARSVNLDVDLRYLSGGAAAGYPVKIRAEIEPKEISFSDYENFYFSSGSVKTGIETETPEPYEEDEKTGDEEKNGLHQNRRDGTSRLKTIEMNLDKQGTARAAFHDLPPSDTPRDIVTELEFRDPNGEVQTSSARIPLYTSGIHVGISSNNDQPDSNLRYQVAVVNLQGKPVPGSLVKVKIFKRSTYSHRRRIAGGFYAFEHLTETKEIGQHCAGKTGENGILYCEGKVPATGEITIQAQAADASGNVGFAKRDTTVYGNDDWFEARNDDRMDLIPVKPFVEPGETMSFQVKMPFREATALVTVEREGIMDAYVRRVTRENPVIEIPVKNNYAPNVFVSALVVRGRAAGSKPTAMFDPGKPAYKLGITEVRVGWKPHVMKVKVTTDKTVYAVRQPVKAHIEVKKQDGYAPRDASEVTIAVIDEGLLELKPNTSWALLDAMMRRSPYELWTATSQMMVVGKRHFGRKALPHGGGGGKQLTRELFDTLIYWKSTVPLNNNGEADVTFTLNDSLTAFRVVAIANSGTDLFGTGEQTIRTTQDLMLISGLPPIVREGDKFGAGFTVRNTSDHEMNVTVSLKTTEGTVIRSFEPVSLSVPAGQAKDAVWQVTAPTGVEKIYYEVSARDTSSARDGLKITQKVTPAVNLRVFQATLAQLTDSMKMDVEKPTDAVPGRGGVSVGMQGKISAGLQGVTEYMRRYPYVCLEQKTSRAIALTDHEMWKEIMGAIPVYLDEDGLAKYFPRMLRGSDALTSYLLHISKQAGLEIPETIRARMIKGLKGFVEGKVIRYSSLKTADLSIRKIAALAALAQYSESTKELLTTIDIQPNLWPTSAVLDWIDVLNHTPGISERAKKLKMAADILRGRLNLQGTTMNFSTESTDALYWLMISGDVNAARVLSVAMDLEGWREDVPRIVRGLVGRMKKGHWDTTTANAWGTVAIDKFSRKYEATPVTGTSSVSLAQKQQTIGWGDTSSGGSVSFKWPQKKSQLRIDHRGKGKPWVTVQSIAAIPLKKSLASGYTVKKTISAIEKKSPDFWSRGDVMRVKLEINARSDMTWVVVSDPIPSGSAILGSGLGRDSALLSKQGSQRGWAAEAYRERSFEALRVYYEFVPRGEWTIEYSLRLGNDGLFNMPETRVEALYAPEMFGELPNKIIEIKN
ncbi:MAG: alpha-2-macroglobulin family protein [Syntrophorhabdaceae bacterium]